MKTSTLSNNILYRGHKSQYGFTLIELMVGMVIGLILLLGVAKIFSANRMTYSVLEATGRLQENGQYAINFIAQQVRQTGYFPNPVYTKDETDDKTLDEQAAFGVGFAPLNGTEGAAAANDSLIVSYYTTATDCVGNPPTGGVGDPLYQSTSNASALPTAIAINTLRIAPGASGRPALWCNAAEVAESIENIQIRYGEDTNVDGLVDSFVNFDNLINAANVTTVQIAILVASAREVNLERDTNTYDLLGTIISPPSDGRIRRVYNTSIKLRNRCAVIKNTFPGPDDPCA